jgi:hypothetical protein
MVDLPKGCVHSQLVLQALDLAGDAVSELAKVDQSTDNQGLAPLIVAQLELRKSCGEFLGTIQVCVS